MNRPFHARHARTIMVLLAISAPFVGWGANEAFERASNHISLWLPQDFAETAVYEEFCRLFGSDDFALVSWDGCTVDDARLERLAEALVPPPDKRRPGDGSERFAAVITGPRALELLQAEPFHLSRDEALGRLEGTLVGPDRRTSCALVTYSALGNVNRPETLDVLQQIAVSRAGVDPAQLRLGGSTVYNTAIDIESERAINTWIALSGLVALAVTWRCLRSLRLTAMVLVVAGYSGCLATAAIFYTGGTMNLVLVVLPVLVLVLTLSASVHLSNYYRDAVRESGLDGAPQRALAYGWLPCTLSAVTTALGLGSLYVSHIIPVKMFGLYSAIGVMLSLGVLFLLLPAMMETWPIDPASVRSATTKLGSHRRRLLRLAISFLIRRRFAVAATCLAGMLILGAGVVFVRTSLKPLRLFNPQSRWIQDAVWFEEHVGSLLSIELMFRFDDETPLTFLDRMERVDRTARSIETLPFVGGTISAATFGLPPATANRAASSPGANMPAGNVGGIAGVSSREVIRRSVRNKRLLGHRDEFVDLGMLNHDGQGEVWRLTVRIAALNEMEYDELLARIAERVDDVLTGVDDGGRAVQPVYTGLVPLAQVGQEELLDGLFKSFCLALVMITALMMLLLKSPLAGLTAMLPNVFPTLIVFGAMGWADTLVDIGAMMTASVALGIAVDDTLHFLTWFRRAIAEGRGRYEAIIISYHRCAPAMTQTTLIAGLGLLVFYLSSFQPTSQFGLLMFVLLVAALVGDLVLLPAILATRLGAVFFPSRRAALDGRGR